MAEDTGRSRLGRGLAALIGEVGDEMQVVERGRQGGGSGAPAQRKVPVEFLRPNPRNPRKSFPESELDDLALSIRQRGLIQPVVARPIPGMPDAFEIVAGERRWWAAQRAGLHEIPVVVVEVDDRTSAEFAVIENIQRSDLNPMEEAEGLTQLLGEFKYTHEDLSHILGKSRPYVTNMTRLLGLPDAIKDMLRQRQITVGHARALLMLDDPLPVAKRIVEQGLTVRQIEAIADELKSREDERGAIQPKVRPEKDPDTRALEKALHDVLGLGVAINHKSKGGELRIRYKTLEQLDGLCRRLNATGG
jgi:ParB family chromosome partitioning protein